MGAPGTTEGPWAVGFRAYDVTAVDGQMKVCDIRGWGYLTGKGTGALGLGEAEAIAIQTANAHQMAASGALYDALEALFASYKELADSGDAGFWSIEDQPVGKQALAALALARGEPQ